MDGMSAYPQQLPEESDTAYAHLCAWLDFEDRGQRGDTAAFAARRGIKPEQVRRLRSKYAWNTRAATVPTLDAQITERATELVVEKAAQTLAEKIADAKERNAAAHAGMVAKVGKKVSEAVELLDLNALDAKDLATFIIRGLREMAPREAATSVQVTQQQMQVVGLEEVHGLPPAQQAKRVREIVAEADRKAALLDAYYQQQAA